MGLDEIDRLRDALLDMQTERNSLVGREIELSLLVNQQGEEIIKLRAMVAKLDGQLGKRPCQLDRCMQHAKLRAENEALKLIIRNIVKTERAFGANEFADAIEQEAKAALRGEGEK